MYLLGVNLGGIVVLTENRVSVGRDYRPLGGNIGVFGEWLRWGALLVKG